MFKDCAINLVNTAYKNVSICWLQFFVHIELEL